MKFKNDAKLSILKNKFKKIIKKENKKDKKGIKIILQVKVTFSRRIHRSLF